MKITIRGQELDLTENEVADLQEQLNHSLCSKELEAFKKIAREYNEKQIPVYVPYPVYVYPHPYLPTVPPGFWCTDPITTAQIR